MNGFVAFSVTTKKYVRTKEIAASSQICNYNGTQMKLRTQALANKMHAMLYEDSSIGKCRAKIGNVGYTELGNHVREYNDQ